MFYSNRSAAYLSKGDAQSALDDAKKCTEIAPHWAKGFGRVGAAAHALGDFDSAMDAYEQGLAVEPSNEALKEGLREVENAMMKAQSGE